MTKMGKWDILGCKSQNLSDCSVVKKTHILLKVTFMDAKIQDYL